MTYGERNESCFLSGPQLLANYYLLVVLPGITYLKHNFYLFPQVKGDMGKTIWAFPGENIFLSIMCTAKTQISCTFAESDDRQFTIKCIVHMH